MICNIRWPHSQSGKPPDSWEVKLLSCMRLFALPCNVAYQAPFSMEFSRQEVLIWFAISFSRRYSWPRDHTRSSMLQADALPSGSPESGWIHWKFTDLTKTVLEWKSRMSLLYFSGRWYAVTTRLHKGKRMLWDVSPQFHVHKMTSTYSFKAV